MLFEFALKLPFVPLQGNVLDEDIGKGLGVWPIVPAHERPHLNLLPVDEHPIQLLDRAASALTGLVVDVAVPLGQPRLLVDHDLAAQNIPEQTEGIVQLLVVDPLVQVLDEDVPHAAAAHGRVALTPHDPARLSLDVREVHAVEGAFGIRHLVVVHVRVSEGATRHGVATDADGGDGPHGVEDLEEQALVYLVEEIADVEGGGVEAVGASRSSSDDAAGGAGGGRRGRCRCGRCGGRGGGCGFGGRNGGGGSFFGLDDRHDFKIFLEI
mmetsp:Transcript_15670/g.37637  ORF Transcript_15670/g.37637 Transcript_15670/m.37637 type:complete len:268 (-) Transcript_15670:165-968(-)